MKKLQGYQLKHLAFFLVEGVDKPKKKLRHF
jgi:hypothetical protein